jgi:hypothetical protein
MTEFKFDLPLRLAGMRYVFIHTSDDGAARDGL